MAPEIIVMSRGDDPYSQASDVYACGIVFYELYSGVLPYAGCSAERILYGVGTGTLRLDLGALRSDANGQRVRKIAAGNPDEASVGLFGVGFFSVFALTDAPEIHSGGARLRFTWAEDSELVADESPLAVPQPGAAFVLPLKPASDALEWGHGEELARLRGMLG